MCTSFNTTMASANRKRKQVSEDLNMTTCEENTSSVRGVSLRERDDSLGGSFWRAEWREDGKKKSKTFSVNLHGFASAKAKAEECRLALDSAKPQQREARISGVQGVSWRTST